LATGRNPRTLEDLARRFGSRVRTVQFTGAEADDRRLIAEAASGPIDMVLDFLPREASAAQVRAAAMVVRLGGRVILMGGLRGAAGDLGLNYNWLMHNETTVRGVWMYTKDAIPRMVRMVRAGLIDLAQFELTEFGLDDANAAVADAAANAGPRHLTVLRPDRSGASD
jgi:alcohol dehydrogenase